MYSIYQYNQEDKYFIYFYKEIRYLSDYVHGMIISRDKETKEWRLIPSVALDENKFKEDYHYKTNVNLDFIIMSHVLGALDIV